jgi:hypothetical protein
MKLSGRFAERVDKWRLASSDDRDAVADVGRLAIIHSEEILCALRLAESPSIAEAVERERESCAKLAESADLLFLHYPKDKPVPIDAESMMALVAAAIRNRKE